MESQDKIMITVEATINAPIEKIWEYWTQPAHITNWYFASDDWHAPFAENDLQKGGKILIRMEAKDGSFGFDFPGIYDEVKPREFISTTLSDNRKMSVKFVANGNETTVTESFEAESQNPIEMQRMGWQAILDNFKNYAESRV